MRRGSPLQTLASSPTMVGAITTLIVIVAVFLAYNANNGLPFVPVYRVSVEVPNASRLVRNNEVRIGGKRVGVIESIDAVHPEADSSAQATTTDAGTTAVDPNTVVARLNLKLDKTASPLPENSVFRIRYRSSFGLKFLDITRGDGPPAPEGFTFNGTNDNDDPNDTDNQILSLDEVALNQGADDGTFIAQTEFDDIGNTFDQRTRNAGRQNLVGYGDAFAGRGGSLNQAIEALNPLLTDLKPVANALIAKKTRLSRFFPALAKSARIVAPVAQQQAELFTNMAVTFAAISADPEKLKETISEGPATLQTGIDILPRQRPFLREFTELSHRLRPGVAQLRLALPDLNDAVRIGTPVLLDSAQTNRDLRTVFTALNDLVQQPSTKSTLQRLGDTFKQAKPLAEHVVPAQTVCNYWNYWFTFLPEHLTERDQVGYNQRVSIISVPSGDIRIDPGIGIPVTIPGEVQTGIGGYSGLQSNGRAGTASPDPGQFEPHDLPILHGNPAGPTGQDGSDCQSGQAGYVLGDARLPGQPKSNPSVAVPDIAGDRGRTTLFYNQDSTRKLKDTTVPSRQP